jgi:hypothetical protein
VCQQDVERGQHHGRVTVRRGHELPAHGEQPAAERGELLGEAGRDSLKLGLRGELAILKRAIMPLSPVQPGDQA